MPRILIARLWTSACFGSFMVHESRQRRRRPRSGREQATDAIDRSRPFAIDAERIVDLVHPAGTRDYRPCPRPLPSSSSSCARIVASRRSRILTI
jgi:hypothetical protein